METLGSYSILESPPLLGALCFTVLYIIYYFAYVVKRPQIACGDKKLRQLITSHCSIASERFWPTWWCFESRFQTVLRALIQSSPKVDYEREQLVTPDKGEIFLDWVENDKNSKYTSEERPTVIFFPGLTGSSAENYILHMVHDAEEAGFRSVVFNNRGTGDSILKTPRTYCASNVEDATFVVEHIKKKHPNCPLVGVGVSLGGMILFNYCAKTSEENLLNAAMVISVGWDCFTSMGSLEQAINKILFNRTLANSLKELVERNLNLFENHSSIDTAHVLKSSTIKQFDDRFTCKVFGYPTVEDYYKDATLKTRVHQLARPVLCLNAADDPFAPMYSIPMKEAEENENIAIVVTSHGGHIGFLEGTFPRDKNYMYRWVKQYISAVVDHGIKKE